ncbi:MAG: hypothetical protein R3F62_12455 [Planctomycetota bacterium]
MRRWLALGLTLTLGCPGSDPAQPSDALDTTPAVPEFERPLEVPVEPERRPLPLILRDVEALAVEGPYLDDALAELERAQNRPRRLLEEVLAQGPAVLGELSAALLSAQQDPERLGYRERRAFVAQALGRLARFDPEAVRETLERVAPRDQRRVAEAALAAPDGAEILAAWREASAGELRALLDELGSR